MSEPTQQSFSPGLKDVIADESAICEVNPDAGLRYRGYDVHELAERAGFEEVAWLILHGELPSKAELTQFHQDLADAQSLPRPVLEMLKLLPKQGHPIDALRTGVSMLGMFDPDAADNSHGANQRKATRLLAQVTTLVTSAWRISEGQEPVSAGSPLAARLVQGLTGRAAESWQTEAFNLIFILYAEHEFNASTFAARVTASTLADMHAAITSAIGALKGPLHGGANEEAMHVLRDIGTPANVDAWVSERLARREKISGIGHRVYRTGDSRVPSMRALARRLAERFGEQQMVAVCEELETVMSRRKGLCANLDLYAAPVLHMLAIPPVLNTPIFACARIAGWCAHVIEQHDHNRLIRPRCLYTGPAPREYPGIHG
jgi:2-methylcitrate synthase/citrate synthase II